MGSSGFNFQASHRRRLIGEDEETPEYAPERWPPILDFLFVFSSFLAAVVAAYFTIF